MEFNTTLTLFIVDVIATVIGLSIVYLIQDKYKSLKKKFSDYYSFYLYLGMFFERLIFNLSSIDMFKDRLLKLIKSLESGGSLNVYSNFPTILGINELAQKISGSPVDSIYLSNEYASFYSLTSHFDKSILSIKEDYKCTIQKNDSDFKHYTASIEGAELQEAVKAIRSNTINGLNGTVMLIDSLINIIKEKRLYQFAAVKVYLEKILDRKYRVYYFSYTLWKYEGLSLKYFKNKSAMNKYNDYENIYKKIHNHFKEEINNSVQEILEIQ